MTNKKAQNTQALHSLTKNLENNSANINQTIRSMSKLSKAMRPQMDAMTQINKDIERINQSLKMASEMPKLSQLLSISASVGEIVRPFKSIYPSMSEWEKTLSKRMFNLSQIAKIPDLSSQSVLGFAKLTRLSDALHFAQPYSEPVNELIQEEFGGVIDHCENIETGDQRDKANIKAGFNEDLIAFPHEQMSNVVIRAGFEFPFPIPPKLPHGQSEDNSMIHDQKFNFIITSVEQHLRKLVMTMLFELEGYRWEKRRVPETILQNWHDRKIADPNEGKDTLNLIYYSDFMDLLTIIIKRDNWNDAFQSIFHRKVGIEETLRRLHPIRNAISHSRPLGRTDIVTLYAEALRIIQTLGIKTD